MRIGPPSPSPAPAPGPSPRPPVPAALAAAAPSDRGALERTRFDSYADALAYCSAGAYENPDIVEVVLEKTRIYRDRLAAKSEPLSLQPQAAFGLCSLAAAGGPLPLRVLDFGGACGAHYFAARALLPASTRLDWIVVETPEMARRAGPALTGPELRFSCDLADAAASLGSIDLLYTSGTLQCVENPCEYLDRLLSLPARNYLFNRLGLTMGQADVFGTHESWLRDNGPKGPLPPGFEDKRVRNPYVFPRHALVIAAIARTCEIVATFEDPSGIFPIGNEPLVGLGLIARRR